MVREGKNVAKQRMPSANASRMCFARFKLQSRNYEIGIKSSIFPLRSRNKTEGFPITP